MIDFAENIDNPLLQLVLTFGESPIRRACAGSEPLFIQVEMSQFVDGRDTVHVRLEGISTAAEFSMLFSNYFNPAALYRVARHAWLNRAALCRIALPLQANPAMN